MVARREAMPEVVIYTTGWCPYCHRAKALLQSKGVEFTEIDLGEQPQERAGVVQRTGRTSVPQIFINDQPIGGSDDLYALERDGELDRLLGRDGT
jgi:glutaredoxin 3